MSQTAVSNKCSFWGEKKVKNQINIHFEFLNFYKFKVSVSSVQLVGILRIICIGWVSNS